MSLFLSGLPLWAQMLVLVVLPTIAAMCGPILLRRWSSYERLSSNNEIAGFKFATVGVIYSVLVAFAVIVVWEKFNDAEAAVVQEAGATDTLYRLTTGPEPSMVAARAALGEYLQTPPSTANGRRWPGRREAARRRRRSTRSIARRCGWRARERGSRAC